MPCSRVLDVLGILCRDTPVTVVPDDDKAADTPTIIESTIPDIKKVVLSMGKKKHFLHQNFSDDDYNIKKLRTVTEDNFYCSDDVCNTVLPCM